MWSPCTKTLENAPLLSTRASAIRSLPELSLRQLERAAWERAGLVLRSTWDEHGDRPVYPAFGKRDPSSPIADLADLNDGAYLVKRARGGFWNQAKV
jgi:hypothetical protein